MEREWTRECTSRSPYWVRPGQIECTRFVVEVGDYLKLDFRREFDYCKDSWRGR
jgi:hypothetical protein